MITPHDPVRKRRLPHFALATALLAGTALGGYAAGHVGLAATVNETQGQAVNPSPTPHALPDFSDLVSQVKPAVVSITSKLSVSQSDDEMGQIPEPFRRMFPGLPFPGQGTPHAVEARGSGFIIDPNGTVVTNNHVVKGADRVTVTLDDGTQLPAKVIGRDSRTDIAVLRVHAKERLPYLQLGNSADVKPGQWVVAVGNPFGLGGTVTAGIVSALSRDIGEGPYDQFIQIDAPINRGNSGGPLFTQDGKVIGINTAILSPSGGSIGIGFAIPSNAVKTVVAQLEKTGHVTRGYIGVEAQQISPAMSHALHLSQDKGALIAGVQPDSPASRAGLQPGDVIEAVNGQKISDPRELAVQIAEVKPGDQAKLDVLHNGQNENINVTVGQMQEQQTAANEEQGAEGHQAKLGLALAPLSSDMRDQLSVPDGTKGAVVQQVQPGSPADEAGLQAGDVIVGVGDHVVRSPSEAVKAIRSAVASDQPVALRIIRDGQPLFVAVQTNQTGNAEGDQG
jgi:serine protease Do